MTYYVGISHYDPKYHQTRKNSPIFYKVYDPKSPTKILAVIHLNDMFPAFPQYVKQVPYGDIDSFCEFSSEQKKVNYIALLKKELKSINQMNLGEKAKNLYQNQKQFPDDDFSKVCLPFEALEKWALEYENLLIPSLQ